MANNLFLLCRKPAAGAIINHVQRRNMPVNVPPTATGKRRFRLEVETDPHKLVNYCCGLNYHIDQEPIKLKPESEYPDWLWNLRLGPRPNSWELKPGTKEYYKQLRREGVDREYLIRMSAPPKKKVVGKVMLERLEYLHHLRFAALAHMEDDIGFEVGDSHIAAKILELRTVNYRDYYLPMEEDRVLYKDQIEGNVATKNYYMPDDDTFKPHPKHVGKRPPIMKKPVLDSKRRHMHSVF